MKDTLFRSNNKLFDEVKAVKRGIRNDIRGQARNCQSKAGDRGKTNADSQLSGYNKALHRANR